MTDASALQVLAMRIRMALMRHAKQTIDAQRLLADAAYAREVIGAAHRLGLPEVEALVRQFEDLIAGRSTGATAAGHAASAPAVPAPAAPGVAPGQPTPAPEPPPADPNDPRSRRYLRGAR